MGGIYAFLSLGYVVMCIRKEYLLPRTIGDVLMFALFFPAVVVMIVGYILSEIFGFLLVSILLIIDSKTFKKIKKVWNINLKKH